MLVEFFGGISTRAGLGFTLALAFGLLAGGTMIQRLQRRGIGQPIREEGPRKHYEKTGTPTMGGLLILALFFVVGAFVLKWQNHYVMVGAVALLLFGGIGLADDAFKVLRKHNKGLSTKQKLALQLVAALSIVTMINLLDIGVGASENHGIVWHFIAGELPLPHWLWAIWSATFIVGFSNATNLTDGLDGLLGGTVLPVLLGMGLFGYLSGHIVFADHLDLLYRTDSGEVAVFIAILAGAICAFLWFNSNPATVFMGDVGALALGAVIATLAVALQFEVILLVTGAVFVVEAASVVIQVGFFKASGGKRVFRMAPIHHHFELSSGSSGGVPEPKLVVRFWMAAWISTVLGVLILLV